MDDETPKIVVPKHLMKLYESAMRNYDEAKALEIVRNICDNVSGFDDEALKTMDAEEQKRRFAADRMADALDLTCDNKEGLPRYSSPKHLTMSDLKAGFCTGCKTPIVLEWKVA